MLSQTLFFSEVRELCVILAASISEKAIRRLRFGNFAGHWTHIHMRDHMVSENTVNCILN